MKTNNFQEFMKIATLDQMTVLSKVIEVFDDEFFYKKIEDIDFRVDDLGKRAYDVRVYSVTGDLVARVDLQDFEYLHYPDRMHVHFTKKLDDLNLMLTKMIKKYGK